MNIVEVSSLNSLDYMYYVLHVHAVHFVLLSIALSLTFLLRG